MPDFSGDYVLDYPASVLSSGAAAFRSAAVQIDHREPMFRYWAKFVADNKTFEYSFERLTDGRAVAVGEAVSRLYWEGDALVSEDRSGMPDCLVTMSWRYELLDGGRRLRMTEQIRGSGRDQDNVWEFERDPNVRTRTQNSERT